MADEEKRYLITAEAQVESALANLGRLETALKRLGDAERTLASASPLNNVSTQAQTRTDAINREVQATQDLNRVRQEQGRLVQTTQKVTRNDTTKAVMSEVNTQTYELEAARKIITERFGAEGKTSETVKTIQNVQAQRDASALYTDISRTTNAAGKVQELAVSYQNIAGQFREVNRVTSENGTIISRTATQYKELDGQIRGTTRTTETFASATDKSANTLGHFMSRMRFMAEWFAFYAVLQLIQKGVTDWMQAQIALSDEMANFEIVTRGSDASAKAYLNTVNEISRATGINPEEIGPGVTAQLRVKNAPSDLALRAAQVQRVTGVDNAQVQRELLGLRLQFPDRTTVNILDAFSGALKRSSLNAAELFGLLETAGPLSQQFNTSLEQILGMMSGLSTVTSESGQSVELYMRQMDRIYSDQRTRGKVEEFTGKPVAGIDLMTGDEVRRPLYDIMADISKLSQAQIQEIANTIPNALGQKTRQLFVAMINGWANVEDATKSAMQSAGEFSAQNIIKMQTFGTAIEGVGAAWKRLLRGFSDTGGAISALGELARFIDSLGTSLGKLSSSEATVGQKMEASLRTSSIWGLLYSLGEDVWSGNGPSPRAQRESQSQSVEIRNRYPQPWSRTANDMSDPTKVGSAAWQGSVAIPENVIPVKDISAEMTQAYLVSRAKIVDAVRATPVTSFVNPQAANMGATQLTGGMSRARANPFDTPGLGDANVITRALKIYEDRINKQVTDMILAGPGAEFAQVPAVRQTYRTRVEGEAVTNTYYDAASGALFSLTGNTKLLDEAFISARDGINLFYDTIRENAAASLLRLSPDSTAAGLWGGKTPADYQLPTQRTELPKGVDYRQVEKEAQALQAQFISAQRSLNPDLTIGKTDAQVLDLSGVKTEMVSFVDSMGTPIAQVNSAFIFLAPAINNVTAALAGLSFVSPPEGVSLGAYGSLAQGYAVKAQKTLDQYGDPNQPRPKRSQIWADDEGGIFKTTVEVSDQAAGIGLSAASKQLSLIASQGKDANALLKQISDGVRDFVSDLLAPTPVTKGDMAKAKMGTYEDMWDEPVRRIQDVMDRREGMNPDLGPWKGFAEMVGVDTGSIEGALSTGEDFKTKFYSGQLDPAFYDKYSKEGFLRAAQEELNAQQGRERLTGQAMGWLKESGMDKDVSKWIGRKITGDISPVESMLFGDKDPAKIGKEIEESSKPIGDGLVKGVGSAFTFDKMYSALEAAWKLGDKDAQKKIMGLGYSVGALMVSGAGNSFGDAFLDAVIAAVMARIDKEYV